MSHSIKIKITDEKNVHLAALSIQYATVEDAKETLRMVLPLLLARHKSLVCEQLTFPMEMPNGVKIQQTEKVSQFSNAAGCFSKVFNPRCREKKYQIGLDGEVMAWFKTESSRDIVWDYLQEYWRNK